MEEQQAVQLLWDEWKYRHNLFWRSLFRWSGAVITLLIIPFLKTDVFKPWPMMALVFPVLAALLSLFSAWILGAELGRFAMVNKKYDELRSNFLPPRLPTKRWLERGYARPIGASLLRLYAAVFLVLSVVAWLLLWTSINTATLPIGPGLEGHF